MEQKSKQEQERILKKRLKRRGKKPYAKIPFRKVKNDNFEKWLEINHEQFLLIKGVLYGIAGSQIILSILSVIFSAASNISLWYVLFSFSLTIVFHCIIKYKQKLLYTEWLS